MRDAANSIVKVNAPWFHVRERGAFSGIFGPDGRLLTEPLVDEEGIVYADVDLARCIQPKQMHDIVGHYNRFDVFELTVNARRQQAVRILFWRGRAGVALSTRAVGASGSARLVDRCAVLRSL